ncbi:hypothetical protein CTL2C_904 [Chlamydia trachomatis L2c]|nr:hypothetical protein CTL2C_904 [Chlamydia trachomatis L2c]
MLSSQAKMYFSLRENFYLEGGIETTFVPSGEVYSRSFLKGISRI